MLVELRAEQARGEPVVDRSVRLRRLLMAWLDAKKGSVADSTWLRYESLGRLQLEPLHDLVASAVTPEVVRSHVRLLTVTGESAAAVRMAIIVLRGAFDMAVRDGLIVRNPTDRIPLPQRNPTPGIALSVEERNRVIASAGEHRALVAVLFGTGGRLGEVLALRWSDIGPDSVSITGSIRHQDKRTRGKGPRLALQEPKTAAGKRVAPLPDWTRRELDALPRDGVFVFHRHNGKPLNPSTVQRAFAAAVEAAGKCPETCKPDCSVHALPKMRLHDARHTFATQLLAAGASLDDVKRVLGHASISVTSDTYGHLVPERVGALARALEAAG